MTTAENKLFIGILLENCYLVGEINFWLGGEFDENFTGGEFFLAGRMSKF